MIIKVRVLFLRGYLHFMSLCNAHSLMIDQFDFSQVPIDVFKGITDEDAAKVINIESLE